MSLTAQQLEALLPDATQLDSDEPEMESSIHYAQLAILVTCLEWLWRDHTNFFIGANLTIYFSRQQLKNRDFRGPDLFLVKNTEKRPRRSWVVWEEDGRYPDIIIELLSSSTATVDRNLKKVLYQDRFRTPEYFWFSPETGEFMGYRLSNQLYEEIPLNTKGWRWSEVLDLYLGVVENNLRYFQANGQIVQTPSEVAEQEILATQQAQQIAEQAIQTQRLAEEKAALAEAEAQQSKQKIRELESRLRELEGNS